MIGKCSKCKSITIELNEMLNWVAYWQRNTIRCCLYTSFKNKTDIEHWSFKFTKGQCLYNTVFTWTVHKELKQYLWSLRQSK